MRLKRRKRHLELTEQEQAKLAEAEAARDEAVGVLAAAHRRTTEVESIVSWLHRARAQNHFSQRVRYLIEHPGEEPPWQS